MLSLFGGNVSIHGNIFVVITCSSHSYCIRTIVRSIVNCIRTIVNACFYSIGYTASTDRLAILICFIFVQSKIWYQKATRRTCPLSRDTRGRRGCVLQRALQTTICALLLGCTRFACGLQIAPSTTYPALSFSSLLFPLGRA
jgi:hypothetical protein